MTIILFCSSSEFFKFYFDSLISLFVSVIVSAGFGWGWKGIRFVFRFCRWFVREIISFFISSWKLDLSGEVVDGIVFG